ncbi:hypothetical protein SEEH4588_11970, partial [Salmonella enterica subsp. enterica serovar Heidelberg str. RI-11-014588]
MPDRPVKAKFCAAQFALVTDDATAHRQGDRVYDGESKPAAACRPVSTGVESDKRFKYALTRIRFNAGPSIFNY